MLADQPTDRLKILYARSTLQGCERARQDLADSYAYSALTDVKS
jgi:hypothetical protein